MTQATLPRWRLHLLRLFYLVLGGGLALVVWIDLLDPAAQWSVNGSVIKALLGSIGLFALLGLWRPLEMIPVLLVEIGWKAIWMLRVALPAELGGSMDADTQGVLWDCLPIIPLCLLVPWDYVWRTYFARRPQIVPQAS